MSPTAARVYAVTLMKALGLVVTFLLVMAQAAIFGTGAAADAFFFARRTIGAFSGLFEQGAQRLFVPAFVQAWAAEDDGDGPRAARRVLWRATLGLSAAVALGAVGAILAAGPLVTLLAPGFEGPVRDGAILAFRILLVGLPLNMAAAVLGSFQFARRRFVLATAATLAPRVTVLAAIAGIGAAVTPAQLSWAVNAGVALMAALMLWNALRALAPAADPAPQGAPCEVIDPSLAPSDGAAAPRPAASRNRKATGTGTRATAVALFSAGQLATTWIDTALASLAGLGALAILYLAQRLLNAAPGSVNAAVSNVFYTEYAHAALATRTRQAAEVATGLRLSLFLILPIAALLLAEAPQIVRLVLERGAFDAGDSAATAGLIRALAPLLVVNAVFALAITAILADDALPMRAAAIRVSLVSIALRCVLGAALVGPFGLTGLAITFLVADGAQMATAYAMLRRALGPILAPADHAGLAGMTGAAIAAGGLLLLMPGTGLPAFALQGAAFAMAYPALAAAFGVAEARALNPRRLFSRVGRRAR
ncbi:lipid II flippase MurJ [Mesobaculum littorinae]|nr:lipid II flippase MurJ [Mesobaculum littorinae]